MKQPPEGLTTRVEVVSVYDGDTVEVDLTRRLRIRLLDCWAPEVRTRNRSEKARGYAARDYLAELLRNAENVVLHVPTDGEDFDDRISFGRVLGRLFADGTDCSVGMVLAGHATKTKRG